MITEDTQTFFFTDDGERFSSRVEAENHEHMLAASALITGYLDKVGAVARRRSALTRILTEWETHKTTLNLPF